MALKKSNELYEVIIVDDCSTDNTIFFLQENYPEIILLKNDFNKGFSPTINRGIFIAQYDYLLLLNSDVKLTENYFENLFSYFDNEDTFGVMGRIIGWDNNHIQDGGKFPTIQGVKIKTSVNYVPFESKGGDRLFSMYLSGANAFVSRKKVLELGGFDELFAPFYIEDVDLSLRAWRMGWKCYYEHNAICRHKTSTTIKSKRSKHFINIIYYRNKMFLHFIQLNGIKLFFWYLTFIPEILIHLFMLKFYYFSSLRMFVSCKSLLNISKRNFSNIASNEISLFDVFYEIRKNLDEKRVLKL
jgi:GT2 family glycosyltransferase